MSSIANAFLGVAESLANSFNSGYSIRIRENGEIEIKFVSKESTDNRLWENHYRNVCFYLGDSANPVKWTIDFENLPEKKKNASRFVDIVDNTVATKYYKTFMEQEALSRMFNISGPQQDLIIKLLYANLAGIAMAVMLVLALYGGGM